MADEWEPKVGEIEVKSQLVDIDDLVGTDEKGRRTQEEARPEAPDREVRVLVERVAMDLVMGRVAAQGRLSELDQRLSTRGQAPTPVEFDMDQLAKILQVSPSGDDAEVS